MDEQHDDQLEQLAVLRQTIVEQKAQIDQLMSQRGDREFTENLRNALLTTHAAGIIGASSSYDSTLQSVVETAADVLDATAASLYLLDEDHEELVFVVALGEKGAEVREFRVPVGQGLAGYVAATGQAIAVSDVQNDPRFDRSIGDAIGYIPSSMLCVPLFLGSRVIGVLQLMDKAGGVTFSASDIEILGRFGNLAAHTIDESRLTQDMSHLFHWLLAEGVSEDSISEAVLRFLETSESAGKESDTLKMAAMVHEIGRQGDAARRLALEVLTSLTRYVNAGQRTDIY